MEINKRFTGSEPSVSWLSHVLRNNIGWNEWIPQTKDELEAYKLTLPNSMREKAYTLKAVSHPIPEGNNIVLKDSKDYVIACNSQSIRDTLIGMAERLDFYQNEYYRLAREVDPWKLASEWPDSMNSAARRRTVIVSSHILKHIAGLHLGYHDYTDDTWYVYGRNNKAIKHKVEKWRHIPVESSDVPPGEDIEKEKNLLETEMGVEPRNFHCFAYTLLRELYHTKSLTNKNVTDAMEDLREAFNEITPGLFPESFKK